VLPDDTILVSYFHPTTGEFFARRYTDGGSLQQTYTIAASSSNNAVARLAYSPLYPDHVFAYWHPDDDTVRVQKIDIASGSVVLTRDNQRFEAGASAGPESEDPELCGVSDSCPLVVWPVALLVPVIDPSLPRSCCGGCGCSECCGSGPSMPEGQAGELGRPVENSWSPLTPDASNGRLFAAQSDPTFPEAWG
jgi:hypothetical protein